MNPVTHLLVGWTLAQTESAPSAHRNRAIIALAGVAPDLDGLGIIPEFLTRNSQHPLAWFTEYHHILGHNITFAAATTAAAYFLSGRNWKTTVLAAVSFHLHLLCDILGARGPDGYQWPIPYLLPFSHRLDITWSGQWALNAWPNFAITLALLVTTFYFAWKRGYSPLEMVSKKADVAFIAALWARFGMPARKQ